MGKLLNDDETSGGCKKVLGWIGEALKVLWRSHAGVRREGAEGSCERLVSSRPSTLNRYNTSSRRVDAYSTLRNSLSTAQAQLTLCASQCNSLAASLRFSRPSTTTNSSASMRRRLTRIPNDRGTDE